MNLLVIGHKPQVWDDVAYVKEQAAVFQEEGDPCSRIVFYSADMLGLLEVMEADSLAAVAGFHRVSEITL
jgi:hypothetical protein